MALIHPEAIDLIRWPHNMGGSLQNIVEQPGLCRTCRNIRKESLPIYYGGNIFLTEIHSVSHDSEVGTTTIQWIRAIGRRNRRRMKHLFIDFDPEILLQDFFTCVDETVIIKAVVLEGEALGKLGKKAYRKDGKILQMSFE